MIRLNCAKAECDRLAGRQAADRSENETAQRQPEGDRSGGGRAAATAGDELG